jgi:hypothetical protein
MPAPQQSPPLPAYSGSPRRTNDAAPAMSRTTTGQGPLQMGAALHKQMSAATLASAPPSPGPHHFQIRAEHSGSSAGVRGVAAS